MSTSSAPAFPCQDISYSGRGAGIEKGANSGIWKNIIAGIRILRPKLIVVENVAAIRRRGLDRVLGDLAKERYSTVWTSLRASDVGAAHRRERVFILGYRRGAKRLLTAAYARSQRRAGRPGTGEATSGRSPGGPVGLGAGAVATNGRSATKTNTTLTHTACLQRQPRLTEPAQQCRQPVASVSRGRAGEGGATSVYEVAWGRYEAAIERWEAVTGRSAPAATEIGTRGQARLSPLLSEWLMGLPKGFVTNVGLPYSAQHRALGNGVVPQQAVAALKRLVAMAMDCSSGVANTNHPDEPR